MLLSPLADAGVEGIDGGRPPNPPTPPLRLYHNTSTPTLLSPTPHPRNTSLPETIMHTTHTMRMHWWTQ